MKKICFFVNLLLLLSLIGNAQLSKPASLVYKPADSSLPFNYPVSQFSMPLPLRTIPGSYYTSQLGFFCKQELRVQKSLNFSLKFRLGSVEYCDKMEGKNQH